MSDAPTQRWRIVLRGIVQGVGMRPFLYRLARHHALTGEVRNEPQGVVVLAEGSVPRLRAFLESARHGPPGAVVEEAVTERIPLVYGTGFRIADSIATQPGISLPPADRAPCDACLRELADPADRRFLYPFVNCTECGPRFSLLDQMPFDREATSMRSFPLCNDCLREFRDPNDRRFHAQAISCPQCGPTLQWFDRQPSAPIEVDALRFAREMLANGQIIAVKGTGGYHLICDATNESAVSRLRIGKTRGEKPFALIAASLEIVEKYASVPQREAALLLGVERPIVVLARRTQPGAIAIAESVAPGIETLGFQLPSTALHHLLLGDIPYVLTSANLSGDPLIIDDFEAVEKLLPLCDGLLTHNRRISVRCDDSVLRVRDGSPTFLRRSRGFCPAKIPLCESGPTVLAIGGDGKSALALAVANHAYVGPHVGDVRNWESLLALRAGIEHLCGLLGATPAAIACDAHPGYLTHRWARDFAAEKGIRCIPVFHHFAHAESLYLDANLKGLDANLKGLDANLRGLDVNLQGSDADLKGGKLLSVCLDGSGYGPDATIWGGEFLLRNSDRFERVARLKPVPLPGGDRAIEYPARMALSHLWSAGIAWREDLACVRALPRAERELLKRQLEKAVHAPLTSSMGRLFDAVASLLGIRHAVSYEAQAAIELETLCDETEGTGYDWGMVDRPVLSLDPAPMFLAMMGDLDRGVAPAKIAGRFHTSLARMITLVARKVRDQQGIQRVGLTGGVCQNQKLVRLILAHLADEGFEGICHRQVPSNDGGLALGQLMLARREFVRETKPLE